MRHGWAVPLVDQDRDFDLIDILAVAAFVTDAEGQVIHCNQAAMALWGRTPAPGTLWSGALRLLNATGGILHPAASPVARTLREGRPPEGLGMLFAERPDGSQAAFLSRPSLLQAAGGKVVGVLELMLDPHPPELIDLAAVQLAAIVASSNDAIIGQSLDGRITSWNDGAMRIYGWQAEEMIDEPIARIIPPDRRREEEDMMAALERGERLEPFVTERITKAGRRISVSVTASPIRDAAGRLAWRLEDRTRSQWSGGGSRGASDRGTQPSCAQHAGDDPGDGRPVTPAQLQPRGLCAEFLRPGAGARPCARLADHRRYGRRGPIGDHQR